MTDRSGNMRTSQARDLIAAALHGERLSSAPTVRSTAALGGSSLAVVFSDGTQVVLTITIRRAQDSTEGESDHG